MLFAAKIRKNYKNAKENKDFIRKPLNLFWIIVPQRRIL